MDFSYRTFQIAGYSHSFNDLPLAPTPSRPVSLEEPQEDEASDVEGGFSLELTSGAAQGVDIGGEEPEYIAEDNVTILSGSQLPPALEDHSYVPLTGSHHSRQIYLPTDFYDVRMPLKPDCCMDGCMYGGRTSYCRNHRTAENSEGRYDLPLLFFKLFFTDEVLAVLVANTNLYAASKGAGLNGRLWKDVTVPELKIWLGLVIYMSVFKIHRTSDYWSRMGDQPVNCIMRFMGLTRFEQIKRYLHCSPPSDLPQTRFYEKMEPVSTMLQQRFQQVVAVETEVSIDECIVRFQGRSRHTVMIRGKPVPVGYYVLALCAAGYLYGFIFSSPVTGFDGVDIESSVARRGRIAPTPKVELTSQLSKTSQAVLHLCLQLPLYRFYVLYCDNLFSSPDLFHILRFYGIAACGTARSKRRYWPRDLAAIDRKNTRMPFNTNIVRIALDDVAAIIWQDKNVVQFLTTAHEIDEQQPVERRRPQARSRWMKEVVHKVWGDAGKKVLHLPKWSVDYNNYMGGVDIHDQLRSYYPTQLKALRSWIGLFFFLLDAAIVNAFLICRQVHKESKDKTLNQQRYFRIQLAWNLCLDGARDIDEDWAYKLRSIRTDDPRIAGKFAKGNKPTGNTTFSRSAGYITANFQPPQIRLLPGDHTLIRAYNKQKLCACCRWQKATLKLAITTHSSRQCCSVCGPQYPICRHCQQRWHTP